MPPPNVEMSFGSHHPDTNGEMMNRSKAANIVAPKRMLQNFCTKGLLFWINDQAGCGPAQRTATCADSLLSSWIPYFSRMARYGSTCRKFTRSQISLASRLSFDAGMLTPLIPEWIRQYKSIGRRPPR